MTRQAPTVPGVPAGARRNLVLLFCDLSDSTGMASGMEPEFYAERLEGMRDAVATIVPRHGGEVVRIDGDGCLCIFGFPEAHEDDGRRAAEAALELHAAVARLGDPGEMRLHSGIHGGIVLLREGDLVRGRFEMLGDATNVAARLCDHAPPGGILASEGTLGSDRHFFRTGERLRVPVKGRAGGVPAFPVLGRADISRRHVARSLGGQAPFAGRSDELEALRRWLDEGEDTASRAFLLHGPPGNGKTRLLDEGCARAEQAGWAVHAASCEAYLSGSPLQAIVQLAEALGDAAGDLAALALDAVRAGPVLLVIDDWQWADDATVHAIDGLLAAAMRAGEVRLRVLLASRQADARLVGQPRVPDLAVPVLSDEAAAGTIRALVKVSDPATAARIAQAAGGSPLLIEELCHAWRRGDLGLDGAPVRHVWIDLLVQSRFAALPPDQADLLQAAAVIGPAMPAWLFAAVTGEPVSSARVAALAAADFLYPDADGGVLHFKHGLTCDAVYGTIGLGLRQRLHALVAEALVADANGHGGVPHDAALAHHFAAAGDAARALPHAMRAGDAAMALGALDRAQVHYRAALAALDRLGDNPQAGQLYRRLLSKFGVVCLIDPSPEHLPVLEGVAHRLTERGDPAGRTRAQYWLGAAHYGMGRAYRSAELLRDAARLAEAGGETALLPMIGAKLAQSLLTAGDYDAGEALCERLVPALRAEGDGADREAFAYLLCCRGFHLADRGDFAAADRHFAESEALLEGMRPPMIASFACYRAAAELMRGCWEAADRHARDAIAACSKSGVRYQAMMGHVLSAYARWRLHGDAEAVAIMADTADWFDRAGSRQRISLLHGWLAAAMAEQGDLARVRNHTARALLRIREGGDRLGEGMAWRSLALAEAAAGHAARADRALERAYRSAAHRRSPREEALTWLSEAEIRRLRGDQRRADGLIERAQTAFAAMGMAWFTEGARFPLIASR